MIDLYFWTTPNGYKPLMLLEELGVAYQLKPINISEGDQFEPEFLKFSPNNRIPAMIDHAPNDGGEAISVFESGAILLYLADKYQQFIPQDVRGRNQCLEWLFWQMGGFGPMLGQNHHFNAYAPEKIPYAIDRYVNEAKRLYRVLDTQLEGKSYICGDAYTIADMACWPWTKSHERQQIALENYPNVKRWSDDIIEKASTVASYEAGAKINSGSSVTEKGKGILFGQTDNKSTN